MSSNKTSSNAIEINSLYKNFKAGLKNNLALNDVSFNVEKGQAFGFVGANGAGKSTTIKIILDLIRADNGSVLINGIDSREARARKGLAFMPENPYLNEYLTPLEVVKLGVNLHQVKVANVDKYCMEWLEKLGIADAAKKNIRQLSKGMAQRTGLAHCLACKPEVLILDEPLSGLDPLGRIDVADLLVDYHSNGGTLLFTSHVLHDVERIADSFALIKAGVITDIKTSEELLIGNGNYKVVVYGNDVPVGYEDIGGGRAAAEFGKEDLWRQLNLIESGQLHLVSVTPTLNLENLFLNTID